MRVANSVSRRVAACLSALVLALVCMGCDSALFSIEGYIRNRIRAHAQAISADDWSRAAAFCAPNMEWITAGSRLGGQAAIDGFHNSIRAINARSALYTNVHRVQKIADDRYVADVTFQVHFTVSSMTLTYSNIVWQAKMLWVKDGPVSWKLAGIHELSPRTQDRVSRQQ